MKLLQLMSKGPIAAFTVVGLFKDSGMKKKKRENKASNGCENSKEYGIL